MNRYWFYILDGERHGPVEPEEMLRLVRDGRLGPDDLVWNPDMGEEWIPVSKVPALSGAPLSAAPGTAPAPGATPNARLMRQALASLRGRWATAVGAALLYGVITNGLSVASEFGSESWKAVGTLLDLIVVFFISGPMALGWARFFLLTSRRENPDLKHLFDGFNLYWKTIGATLLMILFIGLALIPAFLAGVAGGIGLAMLDNTGLFPLGIFLFIMLMLASFAPAVVVGLNYSQVFFVLSDQPRLGPATALSRSRSLMFGFRWKYFCLSWRFFGWVLLGILTCGIGMLWVSPYIMTTHGRFYDDIRMPEEDEA